MLDKEVAEERAELAESVLEDLKEKLATTEVELNVLKEGELVCRLKLQFLMGLQRGRLLRILLQKIHWLIFNLRNRMSA